MTAIRRRLWLALAAGVAVFLAAVAVASASLLQHRAGPRGVTVPAAVAPEPIVVTDAANGGTVHLLRGQTLRVVLGSPTRAGSIYWSFAPVTGGVVEPVSGPLSSGFRSGPSCSAPGMGCGTVAESLSARTAGSADVTASRTSCGEALRCAPDESTFRVTVVVD